MPCLTPSSATAEWPHRRSPLPSPVLHHLYCALFPFSETGARICRQSSRSGLTKKVHAEIFWQQVNRPPGGIVMSKKISCIALTACIVLAAATTSASATAFMEMKPGLWEMTMHHQGQGPEQMPIPQDQLQHLSPEQRAALQRALGAQSPTRKYQTCVKKQGEDKTQDIFLGKNGDSRCDSKPSRSTSHSVAGTFRCADGKGQTSGTFDTEMRDSEHMTSRVTMKITAPSFSMTKKYQLSGHWIGGSCGNVH